VFDTIAGLPVHPLVVHGVVVLVPVAACAAIAVAVVRRYRERYSVAALGLTTAALIGVPIAQRSGNALNARLETGGVVAKQVARHQDYGNLLLWPVLALWVLTVLIVVLQRWPAAPRAVSIVGFLTVVAGVAALAQVTLVGHSGATAVWSCTIGSELCK
jgi:uncharacterized membrane protein